MELLQQRQALLLATNNWVEALVRRKADMVQVAPGFRFTENGEMLALGEGLWQTARGIGYRKTYADPVLNQATLFGVVGEVDETKAIYVARLKILDGKVIEAETLVARKGCHPLFFPDSLCAREVVERLVPESSRLPRDQMIKIADGYFEAIEQANASLVAVHPDCDRRENGFLTTNNPPRLPLTTASGIPRLDYIKKVSCRRYPVVYEERGIVVAFVRFDVPGEKPADDAPELEQNLRSQPRSLFLYEVFKIEDGLIADIEAFMSNAPLEASMGWD